MDYYEAIRPGLDSEWGRALDDLLDVLRRNALIAQVVVRDLRRAVMRPPYRAYSVFYRVLPDRREPGFVVWVVGVARTSRDPKRYMRRR
jgi:hypothetical protein